MKKRILSLSIILIMFTFLFAPAMKAEAAVKISKAKATLEIDATLTLKITGASKDTKVTWSSNKKSVATVNSSGKVTAKSEGSATITAKVSGKSYTCAVTVVDSNKLVPTPTPTLKSKNLSNVETTYNVSDGFYTVGIDIPAGKCNLTAISGDGNVYSDNYPNGINEMFGTDEMGTGYYTSTFKGLTLDTGTTLSVSGGLSIEIKYTKVTSDYTSRSYDEKNEIILTDGNYETGEDIPVGTYKIIALSGDGNVYSDNYLGGINEMFGIDEYDLGYYTKEFYNLALKEGDTLSISGGLSIKLIPAK